VGRKDERWGEVPVAVMAVAEDSSLDKDQVLAWLKDRLGKYKHPRDVLIVDELPRNEMRKVLKNAVRDMVNR